MERRKQFVQDQQLRKRAERSARDLQLEELQESSEEESVIRKQPRIQETKGSYFFYKFHNYIIFPSKPIRNGNSVFITAHVRMRKRLVCMLIVSSLHIF